MPRYICKLDANVMRDVGVYQTDGDFLEEVRDNFIVKNAHLLGAGFGMFRFEALPRGYWHCIGRGVIGEGYREVRPQ